MDDVYYSFEGFADAYHLAEDTRKHIHDVMERYRDKIELGEKLNEPEFMEDMALACGLKENEIRTMLKVLHQSQAWQATVEEMTRTWTAQENNSELH